MDLEKLAEAVAPFAPMLASLLPIPGGAVIGQIISTAISELVPASPVVPIATTIPGKAAQVITTIQTHPAAPTMLSGIESSIKQLLVGLMSSAFQDAISWWFDTPKVAQPVSNING